MEVKGEVSYEDRVRDVTVLHTSKRVIGIPLTLFAVAMAIGMGLATVVKLWVGAVAGIVLLYVSYEIYSRDPNALPIYMTRIKSRFMIGAGGRKKRRHIHIF